jgi:hypothetical protein
MNDCIKMIGYNMYVKHSKSLLPSQLCCIADIGIIYSKFCLNHFHWPRVLMLGSAATRLLDFGLRISQVYGCLYVVFIVCCQVEISASDWSLVQRSPNEYYVSKCDCEASTIRKPWPTGCCLAMYKNYLNTGYPQVCSPKIVLSPVWFQYKATSFNL